MGDSRHYVIPETAARELGAIDRIELCKPHGLTAKQLSEHAAFSADDWQTASAWARKEGHGRRWMIFEAECAPLPPCHVHYPDGDEDGFEMCVCESEEDDHA